jgi:nucleotide-binding universal stress UspA family protein
MMHAAPDLHRVLCPVDFSECSRTALHEAVMLASLYGGSVTAPFVYPLLPAGPYLPVPALDDQFRSRLAAQLNDFVAPARSTGVPLHATLLTGSPALEILALATGFDVIVMGTHGRRGFRRLLLGSVTERVVRQATCPVLTVPEGEHGVPMSRILCAVDLSDGSERTIQYALSLATRSRGNLTVLHVVEGLPEKGRENHPFPFDLEAYRRERVREAEAGLAAFLAREAGAVPRSLVMAGRARDEIRRVAREEKASLIVMGIHGPGPLGPFFVGSTASGVVRGTECPVLTIRPPSNERANATP